MRKEVIAFLESGKLEEYLMGLSSPEDIREVEKYINTYPEVKKEYEILQQDIEQYARSVATPAPAGSKSAIMEEINSLKNVKPESSSPQSSGVNWAMLASIAALLGIVLAGWFWSKHSSTSAELSELQTRYDQLASDCEERTQSIAAMQQEQALLLHSATQLVTLKGDAMGADFYATAFWNTEKSVGHLNITNLPKPPDKHCFQIWADVDGKMINLGVLPKDQSGLVALPFKVNATSLNVTIEPDGGSEHPTVSRLVASAAVA